MVPSDEQPFFFLFFTHTLTHTHILVCDSALADEKKNVCLRML